MKSRKTGPYPYSPIIRRPKVRWPNGARVALWVIPNIEYFALDEKITTDKVPDVPGFAVRDYGNRIGIFRIMETLDRHGVRGTVALNSDLIQHHPEIIEEGNKRGWEWMGHNESNTRYLNDMTDAEAAATVRRTVETIARGTGKAPRGWLSSGLHETWGTLDQLADNGIEYCANWVNDDQPVAMTLDDGRRIYAIPYSTEINDKPAFERRNVTADEFGNMIRRQFDTLWREGETQARVMAICLHPYLIGMPHRIGALDAALAHIVAHDGVWRATGSEIIDAWKTISTA
jgi:peptidoglycan/xylan/chitin deacetylase (PgdA/CDA1 family)